MMVPDNIFSTDLFHNNLYPSGELPNTVNIHELKQPTTGCIAIFNKYCCCTKRGGITTNLTRNHWGMLLMCQNTTMRVYGAWVKFYYASCPKTYSGFENVSYSNASSRQAARSARICEIGLLRLCVSKFWHESSLECCVSKFWGESSLECLSNSAINDYHYTCHGIIIVKQTSHYQSNDSRFNLSSDNYCTIRNFNILWYREVWSLFKMNQTYGFVLKCLIDSIMILFFKDETHHLDGVYDRHKCRLCNMCWWLPNWS